LTLLVKSFIFLLIAALGSAAAQANHSVTQPLRLYVVTGGHDYRPSFYRLFDDDAFQVNLRPHPALLKEIFASAWTCWCCMTWRQ
jgi:hypothetical protein